MDATNIPAAPASITTDNAQGVIKGTHEKLKELGDNCCELEYIKFASPTSAIPSNRLWLSLLTCLTSSSHAFDSAGGDWHQYRDELRKLFKAQVERIADEERPKKKDLKTPSLASLGRNPIGQKHARLTIISRVKKSSSYLTYYNCVCDCGKQHVTTLFQMKSGQTKSCGCLHRKACPELRVTGTREHNSWVGMKQRCNYKDHTEYHLYGGRGIKVCARWNKSFKNFLADMGPRPEGRSLERIDTNGNYELLNCRWATAVEQNRNRRDNVIIEIGGVTACVTEWCEIFNLPKGRTFHRIRKGWSAHQSLFG